MIAGIAWLPMDLPIWVATDIRIIALNPLNSPFRVRWLRAVQLDVPALDSGSPPLGCCSHLAGELPTTTLVEPRHSRRNRNVSNLPSALTNLPSGGIANSSSSEIALIAMNSIPCSFATAATAAASMSTTSAFHRSARIGFSAGPLTDDTVTSTALPRPVVER